VIVGSLLLILGAVVMLALGLVNGSNAYLVGSIAASLLAAIALVAGSRQAGSGRRPIDGEPARERGGDRGDGRTTADWGGRRVTRREPMTEVIPAVRTGADDRSEQEEPVGRRSTVAVQESAIPAQGGAPDLEPEHVGQVTLDDERDEFAEEDPPDEPIAQQVPAADAARVARMNNDVLVIDGRPRYHLAGCVHLLGRETESLPVNEAVELGFTPCGLCEPDSALLAEARRV
jgi:hypothetical protein